MSAYDADILAWSERQSELLRRRAAGDLVNEAEPDWANIAQQIQDVGRSELRSTRSALRQALRHMLKVEAWPSSRDAPNWRADAIEFQRQASDAFAPSMRARIDVAQLYADAFAAMPATMDGQPSPPLPASCPVTLEDLLGDD